MKGKSGNRDGWKHQPGPKGQSRWQRRPNLYVAREQCFPTALRDLDHKFGRPGGLHRDNRRVEQPVIRVGADGRNFFRAGLHGAARRHPFGRGRRGRRPCDFNGSVKHGCLAVLHKKAYVYRSRTQRYRRGEDRQVKTVDGLSGKDCAAISMATDRSQQGKCKKNMEASFHVLFAGRVKFGRFSSRNRHQGADFQSKAEPLSQVRQAASASPCHAFPWAER
jgi:hypothetical protein